jgi:glycosyltransferase involved in cell wall biosynthesis
LNSLDPERLQMKTDLVHEESRLPAVTESSLGTPDRRHVALLTAGRDKSYALGLAASLIAKGIQFEFVGSNEVDGPFLHGNPAVGFLNLRGDQSEDASRTQKIIRVFTYYCRLIIYVAKTPPRILHILWNNKFEWFDRTALMLFYRMCGHKVVYTAHNVNAGDRDGNDSYINRLTLKTQYRLANHIFVHTEKMRGDLGRQFQVPAHKISVIPFGVNSTLADTDLDRTAARARLGLRSDDRVLLFFGNVAPYKGLEYLVEAIPRLPTASAFCRLLIAGHLKGESYWQAIQKRISGLELGSCVSSRIEHIPDDEAETYFKAADALVLPYTYIFQSGVLFLAYNFGLPVLAADVGSLREYIVEGETGFVFRTQDSEDLARTIEQFFRSDLYKELSTRRKAIREFARERYSWSRVASITIDVYEKLLGRNQPLRPS